MRQIAIVSSLTTVLLAFSACGTMAPPGAKLDEPKAGVWLQTYTGECAGREAETLLISRLDVAEIAFDDFRLLRDEDGQYRGGAHFSAPMPEDERDVLYTIEYALRAAEDGRFIGTETIIEGGGHGLGCPIALVYAGAE